MINRLLLYPHGGSGNHGCEAIVRSTCKITNASVTLFSSRPYEDQKYGLGAICNICNERQVLSRFSLKYWRAFGEYHIGRKKDAFDCAVFHPVLHAAKHADMALSIGGDNYCYGTPEYIYLINRELRKRGVKTVLWGCSIEPDAIDSVMLDDLQGYSHIYARESITYKALKERGITQTSLFPDPAFLLDRKDLPLPAGFVEGNTVGINVSPLINTYAKDNNITLLNYKALIRGLIDKTDMQIALIPHVVWEHNDDRKPLRYLYDMFNDSGRIVMIPDHNAEELKGYIARCRFLITARTHASIAAYSEQVPTLVVGYSVKARGIAKDIFGVESPYVIPVQALMNENDLWLAFKHIMDKETEIRGIYSQVMPAYRDRTKGLNCIL